MDIILDAAYLGEKETAYDYLEEMLDLPYYFGRNLDALHDCITELPDLTVIIKNSSEAGDYYYRILQVLEDSCTVIIPEEEEIHSLADLSEEEDDSSDGDN